LLQPLLDSRLHQQTVNHNFNGMVLALVQLDVIQFFIEVAQLAIDARAHITMLRQFGQLLFELAFASAHQRSHHHHSVFRLQ